jgi:hypothetical protein
MRSLTAKQKKLLKQWFDKNYKGGYKFSLTSKIDPDELDQIDSLNYCEIFIPNANNYLEELADKYVNQ